MVCITGGLSMAYFLKQSKQHNQVYLSIYESFYSPDTKGTKHKSIRFLGSISKLQAQGIEDPVAYYKDEIKTMNEKRKAEKQKTKKTRQISDEPPDRFLGYFPLANILNDLDVEEHFRRMQSSRCFHFQLFDVFASLVFARAAAPCSKHRTFHDVIPRLFKTPDFNYDQLLEALDFMGSEYEKFVEILTESVKENYGIHTRHAYFDCTNFFFEIDRPDEFRKPGPSKENRHTPIVGLGLMLDADMIPIGMRMYPGNESEKPVLRQIVNSLKQQNHIRGRTIQIADKGLNCARNIIEAVKNNDGYLFSKSVKKLPKKEQAWVLLDTDYQNVYDKDGQLLYKSKSCIDTFTYSCLDENEKPITRTVTEKRVCIYNESFAKKKKAQIDKLAGKARAMKMYRAKKSECGACGKYLSFTDSKGKKAEISVNEEAIEKDKALAGYNLLVTSEIHMDEREIYNAYHSLWRIEESFRIMKSELDARPVYLQKENRIKGHFFICYATVLLARILQFKKLKNAYSATQIYEFFRTFRVVPYTETKYINLSKSSALIKGLSLLMNQPLTNYYLTEKQIKRMHTR